MHRHIFWTYIALFAYNNESWNSFMMFYVATNLPAATFFVVHLWHFKLNFINGLIWLVELVPTTSIVALKLTFLVFYRIVYYSDT